MKMQKLTINSLALKTIKTRKKQYISMVIGIVLAIVFSSSIVFFASSLDASKEETRFRAYGKHDVAVMNSQLFRDEIDSWQDITSNKATAQIVGYGYSEKSGEEKGSSMVVHNNDTLKLSHVVLSEGRLPQEAGEIAIEPEALTRMKIKATVGDKISLTVKIPNSDIYLDEFVKKDFKIVGLIENRRKKVELAHDDKTFLFEYPAIIVSSKEDFNKEAIEREITFLKLKVEKSDQKSYEMYPTQKYSTINSSIRDKAISLGMLSEDSVNEINTLINARPNYDNKIEPVQNIDIEFQIVIICVLTFVLILASCICIINSFNSNLQDRKKQIGMYRALGATKIQIVKIFSREALYIALVSIPASMLISYFFTKIILHFMGNEFVFVPKWEILICSAIVSLAFVMLASFIPIFKAASISPMQAVRNIELSRKMRNKKIKSQKKFDVTKLVAKRNITFRRGKQISVSILLSITIILSCLGFSALRYMDESFKNDKLDYDYSFNMRGILTNGFFNSKFDSTYTTFDENMKNDILLNSNVKEITGEKVCSINMLLEGELSTFDFLLLEKYAQAKTDMSKKVVYDTADEYLKARKDSYTDGYKAVKKNVYGGRNFIHTDILSKDDSKLKNLKNKVADGKINIDKLNSGEEVILVVPRKLSAGYEYVDYVKEGKIFTIDNKENPECEYIISGDSPYKAGDIINLSLLSSNLNSSEYQKDGYNENFYKLPPDVKNNEKHVKIGAIIYDFHLGSNYECYILTSHKGLEHFYPNMMYYNFEICLNKPCTAKINAEMMELLSSYTASTPFEPYSDFESGQRNQDMLDAYYIAAISIIVLFFSVIASMVNNAITNQIRENKREIGTLRAVGASARELTKIYIRELLSMFAWGIGSGVGLYISIWGVIAAALKSKMSAIPFDFIIWPGLIIIVLLFAICAINVYIKVKKQMKNSIVENIREL